jgi:HlyD family secretion protein
MSLLWQRLFWIGILMAALMILGVGGWAARAPISGVIIVPGIVPGIVAGIVAVRGKPQTVQHPVGGIVVEILVENGDAVAEGATLTRLDDASISANLIIYRGRLREALAREARLTAELREDAAIAAGDLRDVSPDPGDLGATLQAQSGLLTARRNLRLRQSERLTEKIAQFGNQIAGVEGLIGAKNRQFALVAEDVAVSVTLVSQGLAPRTRLNALSRQEADLQGQLARHSSEIARLRDAIGEARIQALQIGREHQEQALGDRRAAEIEIDELVRQIQATQPQLDRVEVRAPSEGIIHEMTITTLGGVVPPGAPILQISPVNRGVEVEPSVPTGDVEQTYPGQSARVRFPVFNQRKTPEIGARCRRSPPRP